MSVKRLEDLHQEVSVLSETLTSLLSNVPLLPRTPSSATVLVDSVTEESLKQFRSRVARRIYRCNALLRELANALDSTVDVPEKDRYQRVYATYAEQLEKHKTTASQWWRHIERQFHRLRMAALLAKESGIESESTQHNSSHKLDTALAHLKDEMIAEADRMRLAGEELEQSSKKLQEARNLFRSFGNHLQAATSSLSALKFKAETDSRYAWGAFMLFLTVCSFIVLKRLRVLSIAIGILSRALWSIKYLWGH